MSRNELLEQYRLLRELHKRQARESLSKFITYNKQDYDSQWFHDLICEKLDALLDGSLGKQKLMIFVPPQHGKQIADSEQVLTLDGWKKHGDLKVGDFVFHPSGKPIKVLGEIPQEQKCSIEITFSNGHKVKCHKNHEWTVIKNRRKEITVEANYFLKNSLFEGEKGKRGSRYSYQLPLINCLEFPDKSNLIDPYCLGAWLGDGSAKGACINSASNEIGVLEYFDNLYERTGFSIHKTTGVRSVYYSKSEFNNGLKKEGLINNKHIPSNYIFTSKENRLKLLAGLIDTDGSLYKKTGQYRFINTNKRVIDSVCELLATLGYTYSVTKSEPRDKPNSSGIQDRKPCYYIGFTPLDEIPCLIKRKRSNKKPLKRRVSIVDVVELPLEEQEEGKCINVDSADGLYLIGKKLIPTHNSEISSRQFPAYALGRNPDLKIGVASYAATLASSFCMDCQATLLKESFVEVFPETRIGTEAKKTQDYFEPFGRNGYYKAIGVGGGLTGFTIDLGIIDDPFKDRQEARSETIRNKVWSWYEDVFSTRLHNNSKQLLLFTRWHEDDLAGRLLEREPEQWEVIAIPALREETKPLEEAIEINDPREIDGALWPEKHSAERIKKIRDFSPITFNSLYQQRPTAQEGNLLKTEWFEVVDYIDENKYRFDIYIDGAYTDKTTNDPTAIMMVAYNSKEIVIVNSTTVRMELFELLEYFPKYCEIHEFKKHRGKVWIEPKASGKSIKSMLKKEMYNCVEIPNKRVSLGKISRVEDSAPSIQGGKVKVLKGAWNNSFFSEVAAFPNAKHDDQVDNLCYAVFEHFISAPKRTIRRVN